MPKGVYIRSPEQIERVRALGKRTGKASKGRKNPHTPEWNAKIGERQRGEKNHRWVGDSVSYKGLHDWISKNFEASGTCEFCGRTGLSGMFINWAAKDGKYTRDRNNWLRLCKKCHNKYDRINERRQK